MNIEYITVRYDRPDGFGTSSRDLRAALESVGVSTVDHRTPDDIALIYHHPPAIEMAQSKRKVLFTMFESNKPPMAWKPYIDQADLVIVPSKFCKKAFDERYGINSVVIPLGIKTNAFKPQNRPNNRSVYTFLQYDCNRRKGFIETWEAFRQEFLANEPVRMIFKTAKSKVQFPPLWPNMTVIREEYNIDQLVGLLASADCFVFPSQGEGFGHTPLEAAATGLPVITVNANGISEYFNPSCMLGVEYDAVDAEFDFINEDDMGVFTRAKIDSLREAMRYAFENRNEMRQMGERGAVYAQQYSWQNTATLIKNLL